MNININVGLRNLMRLADMFNHETIFLINNVFIRSMRNKGIVLSALVLGIHLFDWI